MLPSLRPLSAPWDGLALWLVDLAAHAALMDTSAVAVALSPQEQARAARFVFERDARRFRAARHALRCLLADALACTPAQVPVVEDALGKPHCPQPGAPQFNVSHSADFALIGLHPSDALGVDLELARQRPLAASWSASVLTAAERAQWDALPADARETALLCAWTRKEACLKALGWGLRVEPSQVPAGLGSDPHTCDLGALAPLEAESGASSRVRVWSLDLRASNSASPFTWPLGAAASVARVLASSSAAA